MAKWLVRTSDGYAFRDGESTKGFDRTKFEVVESDHNPIDPQPTKTKQSKGGKQEDEKDYSQLIG